MNEPLRQQLLALAEPSYAAFSAHLLPPGTRVLGVRLPRLHALARQLSKTDPAIALITNLDDSLEERLLHAFVIAGRPQPICALQQEIRAFLPQIDNWSLCDSFCAALTRTKKEKAAMLPFLHSCLTDPAPYTCRFGIVMLLDHYAEAAYIPDSLARFERIAASHYYVQMGLAWAISVFLVKEPALVKKWLLHCQLDTIVFNKALQKGLESRRISAADKDWLRRHKRR